MTVRREIGGYLELEHFSGKPYHEDAIALNCGRGCLAYLVELRGIERIWIPDYMCGSVTALFRREGVEAFAYPVGMDLLPDYGAFEVSPGEWMLIADYYGQLSDGSVARSLEVSGGRLIVDETQGFFRMPWEGADTVYTCRKWFGVADGAYLVTSDGARLERNLERDESYGRMGFVLGRFERPASEFYSEASKNNDLFANEPPKLMSPITENLLRAVDYDAVKAIRDANWDVLSERLSGANRLRVSKPCGAFMYPLMIDGAQSVRERLIAKKIYIPCFWPDVSVRGSVASHLSRGVLPLPLDQRYGVEDMNYVASALESCI